MEHFHSCSGYVNIDIIIIISNITVAIKTIIISITISNTDN